MNAAIRLAVSFAACLTFASYALQAQTNEMKPSGTYPGKTGGVVRSTVPTSNRPGGMAPPMASGSGSLLDAASGPVNYDAQRFIGYVNYLAQNLPEDLALVNVRQNGAPGLRNGTVYFSYSGTARPNPLASRLLYQSVTCLGALRSEIYRSFDRSERSYTSGTYFPVGVAFLDSQNRVVALHSGSFVALTIYKGSDQDRSTELGIRVGYYGFSNQSDLSGAVELPADVARNVVGMTGIVGRSKNFMIANGYQCDYDGELCQSAVPWPIEDIRLDRSYLQEAMGSLYAVVAERTSTFGTLNVSQVGQFCVR